MTLKVRKASIYNSLVYLDSNFPDYLFLVNKTIARVINADAVADLDFWKVDVYFKPNADTSTQVMSIETGDVLFLRPQKNQNLKEVIVQVDTVDFSKNGRSASLEVKRV